MDRHQKMLEEKSQNAEVDALIMVVKKFLPFLENLRKSLLTLTDTQRQEPLAQGLQMIYDNFLKSLESMRIKPIDAL
jgi:molecular chaperone GrpE